MSEVAVIGLACRFPKCQNLADFRRLLMEGENGITELPTDRLRMDESYYSVSEGKEITTMMGGYLDNISAFDNQFFNIAQEEAEQMDPQQRLILEQTWEAFENAGVRSSEFKGKSVGVFVGATNADYHRMLYANTDKLGPYSASGTALGIIANRVSYFYGFHGPSLTVDTGCSSSIMALKLAIDSLTKGEIELAVVGGVNCNLHPSNSIAHFKAGMLSASGMCRPYDAEADGYARSEGAGVIILQKLSVAKQQGNAVWAVVSGIGVNHDGPSNGFTAPNGSAQKKLLSLTYQRSNLTTDQLVYVETHTTGTVMGDAIELKSLDTVLTSQPRKSDKVLIGCVKSNIGHLESASGMAALIKTILMLSHSELYPTINFSKPNRYFKFERSHLQVNTKYQTMRFNEGALFAINTFSFGGTNAHAVLKQPPSSIQDDGFHNSLFLLSAKTKISLETMAQLLLAMIESREVSLQMLTLQLLRREPLRWRVSFVFNNKNDFIQKLTSIVSRSKYIDTENELPKKYQLSLAKLNERQLTAFIGQFISLARYRAALGITQFNDVNAEAENFISTYIVGHWLVSHNIVRRLVDTDEDFISKLVTRAVNCNLEINQVIEIINQVDRREVEMPLDELEKKYADGREEYGQVCISPSNSLNEISIIANTHQMANLEELQSYLFDQGVDILLKPQMPLLSVDSLVPNYCFQRLHCWI